jgi:hypothetical protein
MHHEHDLARGIIDVDDDFLAASQERVRDLVLQAYAEYEETATEAAS